ncbi:hypothetical protein BU15DRAFT_50734, partial [Melanogaster broomeanus]
PMSSTKSTFETLRALHVVIGDALDDIQRVFSQPTFPSVLHNPSRTTNAYRATTDYPSPDMPCTPTSLSEQLAASPDACVAASRIVAACGQISNIVHQPFLSLCDAIMGYHLPACLRLVEHLHIAEILRESDAERQQGLHITDITNVIHAHTSSDYVDPTNLVHALRLLSTHHIFRETAPDTFAITRVASLLDSGKSVQDVFSDPQTKYEDTDGIAAFVGLCTDELFKSAAYLTEAVTGVQFPPEIKAEQDTLSAFNLAFRTTVPYFDWLENGGKDPIGGTGRGACASGTTTMGGNLTIHNGTRLPVQCDASKPTPPKSFRLERFSKAMTGTTGWERPGAILGGFDWNTLPKGSTIVDVGGGIGSTTMFLARTFNTTKLNLLGSTTAPLIMLGIDKSQGMPKDDTNFRFIIQDRPAVTDLGIQAWHSQCPEMLESGNVEFQGMYISDFFQPQLPLRPPHVSPRPAVYLLRVVLHDWPDSLARRILINLRAASATETRLIIADHILSLACVDDGIRDYSGTEKQNEGGTDNWTLDSVLANIEGADRTLAPPPLLPNLGKASATAYSMDLTMQITLNGKERTLRELTELALSAGWRITRMTRPEASLFAYLVCEPIPLPDDAQAIYNAVVLASTPPILLPSVVSDEAPPVSAPTEHEVSPPYNAAAAHVLSPSPVLSVVVALRYPNSCIPHVVTTR